MLRSIAKWLRRSPSPITRKPSRTRLMFDTLEARDVPATCTVTTGADSGSGSLREAIGFANTNGQSDTITFASGVTTVTLTTAQLTLSESNTSTTISGFAPGNKVVIQRSTAGGTPNFRVLEINDFSQSVTLNNLTIKNGVDTGSSGGGGVLSRGATTLNDCTLQDNQAGSGAGIFCNNTLTLNRCVISGNTAGSQGGGVWNSTGLLTVNSSTILNNTATSQGGGIFKSGTFTLTNSTLFNNTAAHGGGLNYTGSGTILGSTFQNNHAVLGGAVFEPGSGGAIWGVGDLAITNSTLTNNDAVTKGGAVYFRGYVFANANLVVTNATIAFNSAGSSSSDGGGIFMDEFNPTALVTLKNTIVAFNTDSSANPAEIGGGNVTAASSYNLVFDASTAGGLVNAVNFNKVGVDPKLATILPAANGGLTSTLALLPDSPAIDAGVNGAITATTDQRGAGFPRVIGGRVDIGAFEFTYTTQIVYDSNGNLLVKDISGRNDTFAVAKDDTDVIIGNSAGSRFRSPVGTVSSDGLTLTIPLTTIRGRLTIAGGDGDDRATFETNDGQFPVFFGSMRFDGGTGVDTFVALGNVSATLSDTLFLMSASKRILLAAGSVAKPERAILVGGVSNNIFDARTYTGTTVLDGQAGNDKLLGSTTGHNILIGGLGSDILQGSATNRDLLIGGTYAPLNVLDDRFIPILAKWESVTSSNFFVVVSELRAGTGLASGTAFTAARLPNDNAKDTLTGAGKNDWYWSYLLDVTDKSTATFGNEADATN
jgi:hypothetical protein